MKSAAVAALALAASLGWANQEADALRLLRTVDTEPFPIALAPRLLAPLKDSNPEVQLVALKFWEEHFGDACDEFQQVQDGSDENGPYAKFLVDYPHCLSVALHSGNSQVRHEAQICLCRSVGAPDYYPMEDRGGCPCGPSTADLDDLLSTQASERPKDYEKLVPYSDPDVGIAALKALTADSTARVQPVLKAMLGSPNPRERAVGIYGIKLKDAVSALELMRPVLNDPDEKVAESACYRVSRSGIPLQQFIDSGATSDPGVRSCIPWIALLQNTANIEEFLSPYLRDSDARVRYEAWGVKLCSRDPHVTDSDLVFALEDPNFTTRSFAAVSYLLQRNCDPRLIKPDILRALLNNQGPAVRSLGFTGARWVPVLLPDAEKSVARYGDGRLDFAFDLPDGRATFERYRRSAYPGLRLAAVGASAKFLEGDDRIKYLTSSAYDSDAGVVKGALSQLAELPGSASATAIEEGLARLSDDDRLSILQTLTQDDWIPYGTDILAGYEDSPSKDIRLLVKRTFARRRSKPV